MKSTGRFTRELRRLMAESYDICRSCGATLPNEVAAYAGYSDDESPLYVGDCCISDIKELATHVYWWWEADKRCAPETVLWRFMDFTKFMSILDKQALYFARADKLGDVFEGAAGIMERQSEYDEFYLKFFRDAIRSIPDQAKPPTSDHVNREATRLLKEFRISTGKERQRNVVSCWHANEVESEALWRLYCPSESGGVAIRTTVGALEESLGNDPNIKIGRIQYTNFRNTYAELHDRIFWKRTSLAHEKEVRAVVRSHKNIVEYGQHVPVDLNKLLLAVVPSPFSENWFSELLETSMNRFGVNAPIVTSEILSEPFF